MLLRTTRSADETRALAAMLGGRLAAGDVLCLIGDLGAGKTTWTQGLALGLGLPPDEPVNSPTFTLVTEHFGGRVPLFHFDVYRLPDASGLYHLAFDEYLDAGGVVVIEWADKIAEALPADRLDIAIDIPPGSDGGEDARRFVFTPHGPRAARLLEGLAP